MELQQIRLAREQEELVRLVGLRAHNLFETGRLFCSEAVLVVLNRGLKGGLSDELSIRLASGLPRGIGDAGCTCGALTGGVLALGLFLGRDRPSMRDRHKAMDAARRLHDEFRALFGSTCCRVLTKKVKDQPKAHMEQCARFTRAAAEMAAGLILDQHPALGAEADWDYLRTQDSRISAAFQALVSLLGH
ncbi:MAG: C-GCAxxG-C-C family protein [Thermodesulfobacteriota bacterium]